MESMHKHQFGKKRQTSHEKGKCPAAAMQKRRGKVDVSYIQDNAKRHQVRHARKKGLFKKAMEYATLTGDPITVNIRNEYFDAREAGLVKGDNPVTEARGPGDGNAEKDKQPHAGCSNTTLSPRAVRGRTMKTAEDASVQCSLIESVQHTGNDRHCRVCGTMFESNNRKEQKLWIGCDRDGCDFWLHAKCLLGDSKKITPQFCCSLPYLCPFHRL